MTSLAPRDAACSATAKPIPDEPPKITTRLFCKPFSCCTESSFLGAVVSLHNQRRRKVRMRCMHNEHDVHASRETAPGRFEPSDYVRRDCGGKERYRSGVTAIAEPAGC